MLHVAFEATEKVCFKVTTMSTESDSSLQSPCKQELHNTVKAA